jgi:hypothetical protein
MTFGTALVEGCKHPRDRPAPAGRKKYITD